MKKEFYAIILLFILLGLSSCGGSNGGSSDRSKQDIAPESNLERNIAFVTSTTHGADMGGLDGADAICNARAAVAGLPGKYVAWLSTSAVDAKDRLAGARGWVRTDGKPFADTVDDITSGKIFYPLRLNEAGDDVGSAKVYTGTTPDGAVMYSNNVYYTCDDWTSNLNKSFVVAGAADATTGLWTSYYNDNCISSASLYCFGVNHETAVVPPANSGRMAFISSESFILGKGLSVADALCAKDAAAAGLSGTYKALLASDAATAASRFDLKGPAWVRPDGAAVVAEPSELLNSQLLTSINLQADGISYLGNVGVWLGAEGFNADGSNASCSGWIDNIPKVDGSSSAASRTDFTTTTTEQCSATWIRVFCLQE